MWPSLTKFYARTFFERLVLYIFLSHLVTKVVFEFALGEWHFLLSRQEQYIFYSLLLADYVLTWRRFFAVRITANHLVYVVIFFLFLAVYGAVIGAVNGNRKFELFNDTVPLIVIALNILRIQSERDRLDANVMYRLLRETSVLALLMCVIGFVSLSIGNPSRASLNAMPLSVFIALFFAMLISGRRMPLWITACFVTVLSFSIEDLNRSSMLFLLAATGFLLLVTFMRHPQKALFALGGVVIAVGIGVMVVPPDSKTAARIQALASLGQQAESRKTSVGERVTEYRSILKRLANEGETVEVFGLGHGALYEMRGANEYKKDYGHAHFSWALFKLRYGDIGYALVAILGLLILANLVFHLGAWDPVSLFALLMSACALIYMFTYVTFILMVAGVSFVARASRPATVRAPSRLRSAYCVQ